MMAKGQKRSNKEIRKPKAAKASAAASGPAPGTTVGGLFGAQGAGKKK
jgi:hypothetical protein